jgi:hypothetical protein
MPGLGAKKINRKKREQEPEPEPEQIEEFPEDNYGDEEDDDPSEHESDDSSVIESQQTQKGSKGVEPAKKKRNYSQLTRAQEQECIDWLQTMPFLYNKQDPNFIMKEKKELEWAKQAKKMKVSVNQLWLFWKSMRTRYGKLLKTKSGDGQKELSTRDQWIMTNMAFYSSHLQRKPGRATVIGKTKSRSCAVDPAPSQKSSAEEPVPSQSVIVRRRSHSSESRQSFAVDLGIILAALNFNKNTKYNVHSMHKFGHTKCNFNDIKIL